MAVRRGQLDVAQARRAEVAAAPPVTTSTRSTRCSPRSVPRSASSISSATRSPSSPGRERRAQSGCCSPRRERARRLPSASANADCAVLSHVLEHVPDPDLTLQGVGRSLGQDGAALDERDVVGVGDLFEHRREARVEIRVAQQSRLDDRRSRRPTSSPAYRPSCPARGPCR